MAGDMVASVGTILVDARDGDMQRYLESLAAMDALDTAQLLPAHGLPIREPRERLQFYVAHRLKREARVLEALRQREREASIQDLLPVAYADTPQMAWPLAALAAEAHLIKLERDGKALRRGEHWLAV
jgi:glyoxylase-like metal-dependent hydrolase (beta-lactamase superfamily II)